MKFQSSWLACSMVVTPASLSSETSRSWKVPQARSTRPFACGVVGHDEADVQLLQRPAELGGVASTPKLLVEALGLFGGTLKDAMPVAVQGQGDSVALDDVLEQQHVAVGILPVSGYGAGSAV